MPEPRLLLVNVDVRDGATVTFDSYGYRDTKCKICEEECNNNSALIDHINNCYSKDQKYIEGTDIRWLVYGSKENRYAIFYDGIELNHVIAQLICTITLWLYRNRSRKFKGRKRNTLLLSADKWSENQSNWKAPDLDAYIVCVWPSKENKGNMPLYRLRLD